MINLEKGERFDLSKDGETLSNIRIGLGWDSAEKSGGLMSKIFGGSSSDEIDIDASVFMLNDSRKLGNRQDLIFFGKQKSNCGSIRHMGDDTTGNDQKGETDNEEILVNLRTVPQNFSSLLFVVNIYDCHARKQHFGMIKNAYVKVYNADTDEVLAKYELSDNYNENTAIDVAEVYRRNGEWRFKAIGDGYLADGLAEMSRKLA